MKLLGNALWDVGNELFEWIQALMQIALFSQNKFFINLEIRLTASLDDIAHDSVPIFIPSCN